MEEIDDKSSKNDKNKNTDYDDFEARLARRKAEKYSRRYEEDNQSGANNSALIIKTMAGVIGCMAVVIIALGAYSFSMAGRIKKIENNMTSLYVNDENIARFINTGSLDGDSKEEVAVSEETTKEDEAAKEESTKDNAEETTKKETKEETTK